MLMALLWIVSDSLIVSHKKQQQQQQTQTKTQNKPTTKKPPKSFPLFLL